MIMSQLCKGLFQLSCLILFTTTLAFSQEATTSIFTKLDSAISQASDFDHKKELKIQSLKSLLEEGDSPLNLDEKHSIIVKLVEEYWSYSYDSTFAYINTINNLAEKSGNKDWFNEHKLKLALLLASSGRYKEAEDTLEEINRDELSQDLLLDYYNCYGKINSDLDYFSLQSDYISKYAAVFKTYKDTLSSLIQSDEDQQLYLQEWELLDNEEFTKCLEVNALRLSKTQLATKEYSYITFQRSMIYEQMRNREMEQQLLAQSAISDIMASRKDNASLAKLALRQYEDGNLERAYRYIKYSFEDAIFYNSKYRFIEIAESFSLIMKSHQLQLERKNRSLMLFTMVISILSAILLGLLYFVYNQKKNLQKAKSKIDEVNERYKEVNLSLERALSQLKTSYSDLAEANVIKELYIGNFMNIYSELIDKLDKYRLTVNKMLRAKKYEQLFDMTNRNLIDQELTAFYKTFDETFLTVYPTFISELNELLTEDQKFESKNYENLNAELRILAVMRLGIKESASIAHILRYSVNTIYNYKAKLKNKAKDKDTFENMILKIGAFDKDNLSNKINTSE